MTIEQLLELSTSQLEAMTDSELRVHFEPLLVYSRPELVVVKSTGGSKSKNLGSVGSSKPKESKEEMLLRLLGAV